ncbi:hypothetical protein BH09ACT12_BH09ACT12_03660 [soil metagenome]
MPYENLDIMLGAPPSVLPGDSLTRVAHPGRAGPFTFGIDRLDDDGWSFPNDPTGTFTEPAALDATGVPTHQVDQPLSRRSSRAR